MPLIGWGMMWVECEWYFTIMAARINGKGAGKLFPNKESYQVVGWLTVYNSNNWPTLILQVSRSLLYLSLRNAGVYKV